MSVMWVAEGGVFLGIFCYFSGSFFFLILAKIFFLRFSIFFYLLIFFLREPGSLFFFLSLWFWKKLQLVNGNKDGGPKVKEKDKTWYTGLKKFCWGKKKGFFFFKKGGVLKKKGKVFVFFIMWSGFFFKFWWLARGKRKKALDVIGHLNKNNSMYLLKLLGTAKEALVNRSLRYKKGRNSRKSND